MQIRNALRLIAALLAASLSLFAQNEEQPSQSGGPTLNELRQYLTPSQRVNLIQAERMIREGESEVVAGQHYADRKISNLNPNEDIKAVNERGKAMIKSGRERIARGEAILEELRGNALEQRDQAVAELVRTYAVDLSPQSTEAGLATALRTALEAAWKKDYDSILFDGLYLTSADATVEAPAALRNTTYDKLVEIDGTNFSVSVPIDLKIEVDEAGSPKFLYRNAEALGGKRVALLAAEFIQPAPGTPALLVVSLLDTGSLQVVSQSLARVEDFDPSREEEEEVEKEEIEVEPDLQPELPLSATIVDSRSLFESLARLETPYLFELRFPKTGSGHSMLVENAIVTQLIVENTDLALFDAGYVSRAYLSAGPSKDEEPRDEAAETTAPEEGEAAAPAPITLYTNARLEILPAKGPGAFAIRARAGDLSRVVDVGPLSLRYPEPDTAEPEIEDSKGDDD